MKLSAEQFAELAATFHPQPAAAPQHERRRAARTELIASVKITPVIGEKYQNSMSVMICDFSARGVAFIHASPMERGRQFVLELPRSSGGVVMVLCTVTHVKPVGPSIHRVGAEFTCVLEPSARRQAAGSNESSETQRIRATMLR